MTTILHVDMDAFFASVEVSRHPQWRGKPVVVGSGPHERGVVSTCNYEARKYGIRSAMPSQIAYRLCPSAIFVRPDMKLYETVSRKSFEIFERFTPFVEAVSIDEAFLDITGSIHLYGSSKALGEQLRETVKKECGVTCSVGIATNRLLAKIGSEENKPDGLTIMPSDEQDIAEFLKDRPVRILWGVGKHTEEALKPFGIKTCGDIQKLGAECLATVLSSKSAARTLVDYAFGRDTSKVQWQKQEEKSVSREHTFAEDETRRSAVRAKLLELVSEVGMRLRTGKRWARTARVKIRNANFETCTRQVSLAAAARDDITLRKKALELFDGLFRDVETLSIPVRLIGFGVTNIQNHPDDELSLLPDPERENRIKRERLSDALDSLHRKFPRFADGIQDSTFRASPSQAQ